MTLPTYDSALATVADAFQSTGKLRRLRTLLASGIPWQDNAQLPAVQIEPGGYLVAVMTIIKGTVTVNPGTGTATFTNPFNAIRNYAVDLQTIVRPRALTGRQENIVDSLDMPVIDPYMVVPPAGNLSQGTYNLEFYLYPKFALSNVLLDGVRYLDNSTNATISMQLGSVADMFTLTGNATITGQNLTIEHWKIWIDREAPIPPSEGGQGQGLWREVSRIRQVATAVSNLTIPSAGSVVEYNMTRNPNYLRIIIEAFNGGAPDINDSLVDWIELTANGDVLRLRRDNLQTMRIEYENIFLERKPGGLYVMTFFDATGDDSQVLVTRELSNLKLRIAVRSDATVTNPAYFRITTDSLVDLLAPPTI